MTTESFELDRTVALALLQAGIRAPSADNQHHVRFALLDDGVDVRTDEAFRTTRVFHRTLLTLISFGAVIENMRLRLTERGFTFRPDYFPEAGDPSVLLRLRRGNVEPVDGPDPLARQIESRQTNRSFFKGPKLVRPELDRLEDAVGDGPEVALHWLDGRAERSGLLRMIRMAESERFARPALHREMFESIDFKAGWHTSAPDRLSPGSLGVERGLRLPFATLRHWPVMRAANWFGAHRAMGLRAGDLPARTAPHLGVLSSTLPPEQAALHIGARFQRLWLAADAMNLALQPMVASAILSVQADPLEGLGPHTFGQLRQGWRSMLGAAQPYVVFRLGQARRASVASGRKPLESYLI